MAKAKKVFPRGPQGEYFKGGKSEAVAQMIMSYDDPFTSRQIAFMLEREHQGYTVRDWLALVRVTVPKMVKRGFVVVERESAPGLKGIYRKASAAGKPVRLSVVPSSAE